MTDESNGASDEPEIPVEVTPESPPDRQAALEQEKKELHDRLLRTAADFDNFRKRSRKDVEDARTKGREEMAKEILPVVDNLERALSAAQGQTGSGGIIEGVQLVLRQLLGSLERFEIKPVSAMGEAFDPARHEAISQVPTADAAPGTVVAEMQKGYTMGSRLIRPAMVAVATAPAQSTPPADGATEGA
jgi:molecular chaperone GrpE